MESVMILGAGPLQVPAIKKAKEMDMHVIVCDYNPDAVGFQLADESYLISTIDQEAVLEKAREIKPDYVITSTSDAPVRTVAYVSEKLGLPVDISYENAMCATIKSKMRKRLQEYNVPIPKFFVCNSFEEFRRAVHSFPDVCIIKPSDGAASRGVMQVDVDVTDDDLKEKYCFCKENSKNKIVLVEEFMRGPEVSVESFVINGEVDIIAITDKIVTELPYFVELGHAEQSQLRCEVKKDICDITKMAIKAIGIVNGVSHTEVIITEDGPKIVEIAARLGGDFITSKLVPISTGVDMVENSLLLALHKPIDLTRTKNCGSAIRFIAGKKGILRDIRLKKDPFKIEGVIEVEFYKKTGELINDMHSSNDRLGHVIASGTTTEEAIRSAERALEQIEVVIEEK